MRCTPLFIWIYFVVDLYVYCFFAHFYLIYSIVFTKNIYRHVARYMCILVDVIVIFKKNFFNDANKYMLSQIQQTLF